MISVQPSERAIVAIIGWEVGSPDEYETRPEWPGGDSGITIGIGYDLGYETTFRTDWQAHLPAGAVARLATLRGLIGAPAMRSIGALRDIVVPFEAASAVFRERTLPRETARTLAVFPGAEALSGDSFGALVSLVFNRGASLDGDRRSEMRGIRDALAQDRACLVPEMLRGMKRLWPNTPGLQRRRDGEALLFEAGLPLGMMDIG